MRWLQSGLQRVIGARRVADLWSRQLPMQWWTFVDLGRGGHPMPALNCLWWVQWWTPCNETCSLFQYHHVNSINTITPKWVLLEKKLASGLFWMMGFSSLDTMVKVRRTTHQSRTIAGMSCSAFSISVKGWTLISRDVYGYPKSKRELLWRKLW